MPQVHLVHMRLSTWLNYIIILDPVRKTAARVVQTHPGLAPPFSDERQPGDIPMKKILIAVSAFTLFAAYSGMAHAQDEATKTEKTEKKTTKKSKKGDKAAEGAATTETKTEKTEKAPK